MFAIARPSLTTRRSLEIAASEPARAGRGRVGPEQVLLGVLAQADSGGVVMLEDLGVDLVLLRQRLGAPGEEPADRA